MTCKRVDLICSGKILKSYQQLFYFFFGQQNSTCLFQGNCLNGIQGSFIGICKAFQIWLCLWMMNSLHSRLLFLLQLYSDPFSRFDLSADNLRFLTMKLPWHISPFLLLCAYFCSVFNRGWNENVFRSNQRNAFHFILEVIKSQILLRYIVYRLLVVKN